MRGLRRHLLLLAPVNNEQQPSLLFIDVDVVKQGERRGE